MTYAKAMEEIKGYRDLEVGFDSYNGKPGAKEVLEFGCKLLELASAAGLPEPHGVVSISTGFCLDWVRAPRQLYFEVDDHSVWAFMIPDGREEEDYEDETFDVNRALKFLKRFLSEA